MSDGFTFRALAAGDSAQAALLHAAAFAALEERPWSAAEIGALLASSGVQGKFVQRGGKEIGFALLRVVADEAEVLTIAVHPTMHRQGAGRALLTAAIDAARTAAVASLFLEVGDDNAGALALYRAAGFAEIGRRKAYYRRASRPAADAVVMRLTL
ncbi:MAG: ribosomal protein S18-alanine N-acetyltransferase [Alphaproteobacteria bacterium]|nr:ribosomal protein S18-alanine N-acetyltransferase [Alphaproteobacteria bacterium]